MFHIFFCFYKNCLNVIIYTVELLVVSGKLSTFCIWRGFVCHCLHTCNMDLTSRVSLSLWQLSKYLNLWMLLRISFQLIYKYIYTSSIYIYIYSFFVWKLFQMVYQIIIVMIYFCLLILYNYFYVLCVVFYFLVPTSDQIISKFLYDGCGLLWLNGVLVNWNDDG